VATVGTVWYMQSSSQSLSLYVKQHYIVGTILTVFDFSPSAKMLEI